MLDIRKELREAWEWLRHAARSRRHWSFFLMLLGFGLLVEHLWVYGTMWHTKQLIFDHGFLGLLLIVVGFLVGLLRRERNKNKGVKPIYYHGRGGKRA